MTGPGDASAGTGGVLLLALVALLGPSPSGAQQAHSYTVRDAAGPSTGDESTLTLDFYRDPDPLHVVQGPEFTWIVRRGDALTRQNALMILSRNVPVGRGTGSMMLRGWGTTLPSEYDEFSFNFIPGEDDRNVAGRPSRHYRLEARIRRGSAADGVAQQLEYDADLWVIEGIPHSWAPFGTGTRALPSFAPRLRDSLDIRLADLGLVGRAIIRQDFLTRYDGQDTRSSRTRAFQIADLEPTEAPPSPGPVVDRAFMDALTDQLVHQPTPVCLAAMDGELPEAGAGVDEDVRTRLLAMVNDRCERTQVYFGLVVDKLRSRPDALCAEILAAEDMTALASVVFTEAERTVFMAFVPDLERPGFRRELRRYCETRGGSR